MVVTVGHDENGKTAPTTVREISVEMIWEPIRKAGYNARLLEDKRALQADIKSLMQRFPYDDILAELQEYEPTNSRTESDDLREGDLAGRIRDAR